MFKRIAIVGSGNVANHLGRALVQAGLPLHQVLGRNQAATQALAQELDCSYSFILEELDPECDLCLLAVNDDAIAEVAAAMPEGNFLLAHTSGGVNMNVLASSGPRIGVFYPLQTFSKGIEVAFQRIPICLEASVESDLIALESLAGQLSTIQHRVNSEQRKAVHLAAVFVNNFSNHLYQIGSELLDEAGLPMEILHPLMEETARKAQQGPPADWQTGPARRGDERVMAAHEQALSAHPLFQKIYTLVSQSILRNSTHD